MMFSYLYSNWIYFILLLYNPKQNDRNVDDGDHPSARNLLSGARSTADPYGDSECSEAVGRVDAFVTNCVRDLSGKLDALTADTTHLDVELRSVVTVRDVRTLSQYLSHNYESLNCEQLEEFEETIKRLIDGLVVVADDYGQRSLKAIIFNKQNILDLTLSAVKCALIVSALLSAVLAAKHVYTSYMQWPSRPVAPMAFTSMTFTRKSLTVLAMVSAVLVSIGWKWRQKYLIELSRKQCYVLQTPDECLSRHHEMTFVSWIRQYMYSYEQRRHDYYRAVTVDPFWEINPLTVVSELLAELFFTPLTSLGHFLGLFMSSYFSHIPLYLTIPVFIFLCFCTLLMVLLIAVWLLMPNRYSIRIPFLMTIQLERRQQHILSDETIDRKIVRKYQIQANVVNVYHSLPPNNTSFDNTINENQIKFDENLCFQTNKPISIPYSEVD